MEDQSRSELENRIRTVLEDQVNPLLASHYGGATLVKYENGIAKIRLTGACSSCPSAQYTLEEVVKAIVTEAVPEVLDVVLDTSVSEDLLEMARKILNKQL